MLALFGINYSQWKVKKSVTFQMLAEDLYYVLVSTIQEADDKVGLDGQQFIGEVSRVEDGEKSEVARENCQTTMPSWCLWREVGRKEDWRGEI